MSGCRAELHDVLAEYKEGAAKFIGKAWVFAAYSSWELVVCVDKEVETITSMCERAAVLHKRVQCDKLLSAKGEGKCPIGDL